DFPAVVLVSERLGGQGQVAEVVRPLDVLEPPIVRLGRAVFGGEGLAPFDDVVVLAAGAGPRLGELRGGGLVAVPALGDGHRGAVLGRGGLTLRGRGRGG